MTKSTFCSAFWSHTNIRGGNRIFPCCRYKTAVQQFNGDVDSILLSTQYSELRKNSEAGIENKNCQKCYDEESLGKSSLRQWFNENYSADTVSLKYLEVGFDNICNLTCDGCWEEWSSSWWIKKNPNGIPKAGILSTEECFNIPLTLEKIVFLGGEPLMTNRHRTFLEQLPDLSQLAVTYYTNGMFDLTERDHAVLSKCQSVHFIVSIDAHGKLNDTVRSGSDWNTIESFVNKLPYRKTINSVLHRNNWHGFSELHNWIHQHKLDWRVNILTYPYMLSINTLNKKESETLLKTISSLNIPNKEYIISYIKKNINDPFKTIPIQTHFK